MKKIFNYITTAVLALGLAACSKEVTNPKDDTTGNEEQITLTANIVDGPSTKTELSGNDTDGYKVLWSLGDYIYISTVNETKRAYLTQGAGTTSGVFNISSGLRGTTYEAYYGDNLEVSDYVYLAKEQTYSPDNKITSAPMMAIGTISGGKPSDADFKNLCGVLRIDLKGDGIVKEIKVTTDQDIYGTVTIKEDGSLSVRQGVSNKTVVLNCGENGVELTSTAKAFYITLPQRDYTGVKIEVSDFSGNTCTKTLKADKTLNIARAQITPVPLTVSFPPAGALSGKFTVNEQGKQVCFSKGNLWYGKIDEDAASATWNFENYQYIHSLFWDSNHVAWFFFHKAGEMNRTYAEHYTYGSRSKSDILFTNRTATTPNPNFVVNGVTGKYRTLSKDEWSYLLANHAYYRGYCKNEAMYDVEGLFIAPDDFDGGAEDLKTLVKNGSQGALDAGVVFLPLTGERQATYIDGRIAYGYYWSSVCDEDTQYAFSLYLPSLGVAQTITKEYRKWGRGIRLVTDCN